MKNFKTIKSILAVSILGFASVGYSIDAIQDLFIDKYPAAEGTSLDDCSTCHQPAIPELGFLNRYGYDLKVNNVNFGAVEAFNSDADDDWTPDGDARGWSNIQEIIGGTNPGSQAEVISDEDDPDNNRKNGTFFMFEGPVMGDVAFNHSFHIVKLGATSCNSCHASGQFLKEFDDTEDVSIANQAHNPIDGGANGVCMTCHSNAWGSPGEDANGRPTRSGCLKCHTPR